MGVAQQARRHVDAIDLGLGEGRRIADRGAARGTGQIQNATRLEAGIALSQEFDDSRRLGVARADADAQRIGVSAALIEGPGREVVGRTLAQHIAAGLAVDVAGIGVGRGRKVGAGFAAAARRRLGQTGGDLLHARQFAMNGLAHRVPHDVLSAAAEGAPDLIEGITDHGRRDVLDGFGRLARCGFEGRTGAGVQGDLVGVLIAAEPVLQLHDVLGARRLIVKRPGQKFMGGRTVDDHALSSMFDWRSVFHDVLSQIPLMRKSLRRVGPCLQSRRLLFALHPV
uniref:Transcriptional regulator n=1 Tax=Parastrongyloides trichosuri TaxID=131310 RepID=A0A0N4Z3S0_PARTI